MKKIFTTFLILLIVVTGLSACKSGPKEEVVTYPIFKLVKKDGGEALIDSSVLVVKGATIEKTFDSSSDSRVHIGCDTPGVKIYYTTNGSDPTEESTEFVEKFEISGETVIKAIAVKVRKDDNGDVIETLTSHLVGVKLVPQP